jgi:hypothetical protein
LISSTRKFTTKEQLTSIIAREPNNVHIQGAVISGGGRDEEYDGLLSQLPYGKTVAVWHKKTLYSFRKGTDGVYTLN